jgi:hypothetical protein
MPTRVNLPDGRIVNFPDGMSAADIEKVIASEEGMANPKTAPSSIDLLTGRGLSGGEGEPSGTMADLISGLKPLAHPESPLDFAALTTMTPNIGVRGAAGVLRRAASGAMSEAKTIRQIPGRMLGQLYKAAFPSEADLAAETDRLAQPARDAIRAQVAQGADQYQMPRADIVVDRPPRAAQVIGEGEAAPASGEDAASPLSSSDRAQLTRQNYPPELIQKIEGQLRMAPSHTPVESPLRQPRVDIGAEKIGRQQGLSKQAVRDMTGPVLNETPGEASPIPPQEAHDRVTDALLQMGHGNPERQTYVAKATSQKAMAMAETIRRALERAGLIVPFGVGAMAQRGSSEEQ